mmetsp:Transcript_3760/g.8750  ORF Transcript_3760/g.8750 Transcript_3760/m.8750 type:complete len:157 (+) Transcript_3760:116-586(+)
MGIGHIPHRAAHQPPSWKNRSVSNRAVLPPQFTSDSKMWNTAQKIEHCVSGRACATLQTFGSWLELWQQFFNKKQKVDHCGVWEAHRACRQGMVSRRVSCPLQARTHTTSGNVEASACMNPLAPVVLNGQTHDSREEQSDRREGMAPCYAVPEQAL